MTYKPLKAKKNSILRIVIGDVGVYSGATKQTDNARMYGQKVQYKA